jgi:hypothetical protein
MKATEFYQLPYKQQLAIYYGKGGFGGRAIHALWFCVECGDTTVHKKLSRTLSRHGNQQWECSECGNVKRVVCTYPSGPRIHPTEKRHVNSKGSWNEGDRSLAK